MPGQVDLVGVKKEIFIQYWTLDQITDRFKVFKVALKIFMFG